MGGNEGGKNERSGEMLEWIAGNVQPRGLSQRGSHLLKGVLGESTRTTSRCLAELCLAWK